jgi:hypothetical protein
MKFLRPSKELKSDYKFIHDIYMMGDVIGYQQSLKKYDRRNEQRGIFSYNPTGRRKLERLRKKMRIS